MGRPPIDGIVLALRKAALTTLTHLRARYGFPRPVLYNSHAEHEGRLSHPRLVVLLGGWGQHRLGRSLLLGVGGSRNRHRRSLRDRMRAS